VLLLKTENKIPWNTYFLIKVLPAKITPPFSWSPPRFTKLFEPAEPPGIGFFFLKIRKLASLPGKFQNLKAVEIRWFSTGKPIGFCCLSIDFTGLSTTVVTRWKSDKMIIFLSCPILIINNNMRHKSIYIPCIHNKDTVQFINMHALQNGLNKYIF
jgi:hypothetical protein